MTFPPSQHDPMRHPLPLGADDREIGDTDLDGFGGFSPDASLADTSPTGAGPTSPAGAGEWDATPTSLITEPARPEPSWAELGLGFGSPGSRVESSAAPDPAQIDPPQKRRQGRRAFLAGFLAATVIAAAGFGIGRITADTEEPAPAPTAISTIAPSTTAPAATEQPVAPTPTVPATVGDLEPVAAAAAAVAPAVVQLDTNTGLGSGVVYDARGYILTAAHVIEGSDTVLVRFADGRSARGTVVGLHEPTDIAVVSVDPAEIIAIATLADGSELTVGQTAVAVGSPFGLDQTVTSGIVSATDRIVSNITMVQTDAAINPGNSGGPLVDLAGRVIGINDQIFTNSGGNEGVGFAIAIDLAVIVADQLVAGEDVGLAFLGVSMTSPPNGDAGALIQEVVRNSAAASGGLQVGDLVVAVQGDPIRDPSDLRAEITTLRPGTTVDITVIRDGAQIVRTVTLGTTG